MDSWMEPCKGETGKGPAVCITFSLGKGPRAESRKMESSSPSDNSCPS